MIKMDSQLKQDIETELRWDPKVNAAQIGVSVDTGAVTLLGVVDTYGQRKAAEEAARRVGGVRSLAQDLTVKILSEHTRTDPEIAAAVQGALAWDVSIPKTITATVEKGTVTLGGNAKWNYERDAAEQAVRNLMGIVAVHNCVALKPETSASELKHKVETALLRQAIADSKSIVITTDGSQVTLTGQASSWHASEDAASAAWSAPGVTHVTNQVQVVPTP
jgi:osmotically-inducible protein OsmY